MEAIFGFINAVTGWIWGIPILVLLVGGGLILTVVIGGIQFSRFGFIMKNTAGTMFDKEEQARKKALGVSMSGWPMFRWCTRRPLASAATS